MALNRFLVPQYITTEPKILGPVTVRQFITMLVGILIDFIVWNIFVNINQNVGLVIMVIVFTIFVIFAFAKVNSQNFHYFALNIIRTLKRPSLKVWKKAKITKLEKEEEKEKEEGIPFKPLPQKSRLSDISLLVDTGGAYNLDLQEDKNSNIEELNI